MRVLSLAVVLAIGLTTVALPTARAADAQGAANIQIVKHFLADFRQAMGSHDAAKVRAVIERSLSADFVDHAARGYRKDREGYIESRLKMIDRVPLEAPGSASAGSAASSGGRPRDFNFVGDGELVAWASEGGAGAVPVPPGESPHLFFNMFRIVNGKITEHWNSE